MSSTSTTTSSSTTAAATESPVASRKRPAEDEASEGDEHKVAEEPASAVAAAGDAAEDGTDGEQQPAKRARTQESEDDGEGEEKKDQAAATTEDTESDKAGESEQSSSAAKLAFVPTASGDQGFSSFSSYAGPLSFSSVSASGTDSGAAPLSFTLSSGSTPGPFSIDFSSPTPFGSLFGGESGKDSGGATPSLTSSGFTLFSSSAPSTSSDFAFNLSSSSSSLLFSTGAESSSTTVAEKVEVVTGEENEDRVHSVRAKLLKLEPESQAWKERGSGQLHLNVAKDRSYARLVMRAEGALRLILNAALFPHTIAKRVQEKGVQVSAVEEGKPVLYLLRVARRDEAEELFAAINSHKNLTGSA